MIRRIVWLRDLVRGAERVVEFVVKPFETFLILPDVEVAQMLSLNFRLFTRKENTGLEMLFKFSGDPGRRK